MVPVAVLDTGIKRKHLVPLLKQFSGILNQLFDIRQYFETCGWLKYKWSVPKDKLCTLHWLAVSQDQKCFSLQAQGFILKVGTWVLRKAAQLASSFNMHCVHALLFLQFTLITGNNIADDLLGFEIHLKILIQILAILNWASSLNFFWKMGSCSDWRCFWSTEFTLHVFKRDLACSRLY